MIDFFMTWVVPIWLIFLMVVATLIIIVTFIKIMNFKNENR